MSAAAWVDGWRWRMSPLPLWRPKMWKSLVWRGLFSGRGRDPVYHRMDASVCWRSVSGRQIRITGYCLVAPEEEVEWVEVRMNGGSVRGEWGLPRTDLPPTRGFAGGSARVGYHFNFPLPPRGTELEFVIHFGGGGERIFARRLLEVRSPSDGEPVSLRLKRWRSGLRVRRVLDAAWNKPGVLPGRRVLLVAHELSRTGAPILLLHLARVLQRSGHVPVVVCLGNKMELRAKFEEMGVPVLVQLLLKDPSLGFAGAFAAAGSLTVVANTVVSAGAVEGFRRLGIPVVWWIQDGRSGIQSLQRHEFSAPAYQGAAAVVFPSRNTAGGYASLGVRPVEIVPNGIPDLASGSGEGPVPREPGGPVVFTLVGLISERKGQDVFLRAAALLAPELRARARFVLVGAASNREFHRHCLGLAAELPRVQWAGACSHAEAVRHIRGSDVIVVASRDEALPVVLQEAMSLGRALVATQAGGTEEYIEDGVDGLLVPVNDAESLARAMARCLEEPGLVERLGTAGRKTYEARHHLDFMGARFAEIIQRVAVPA